MLILALTTAFIAAYTLVLLPQTNSFKLDKNMVNDATKINTGVSVIIPFRNEAKNLNSLIASLNKLDCSDLQVEFILVNDHSEDEGSKQGQIWLKETGLSARFIDLPAGETGKKVALKKGIENSTHEVIATLDADCRPSKLWLKSMLYCLNKNDHFMVTGPVRYVGTNKWSACDVYQQMESAVLMAMTAKQFDSGNAVIANGANLCFKKTVYKEAEAIRKDGDIAGGDDIFLLEAVEQLHPGKIGFAGLKDAVIETDTEKNWGVLLEQRARWASKVRYQQKPGGFLWQWAAFAFSLLYAGLALVCAARMNALPFLAALALKAIADLWIVHKPLKKMGYELPFILKLGASFLQPIFIFMVGCKARFGKFYWKGRLLKA